MTMHATRARGWLALTALWLLAALAACGGSDAPPPAPAAVIGAAGGTVNGPPGARVTVPPGALAVDTPVAIAASAQGAPALPADLQTGGAMFAFTPHGITFAQPVTVQLPFDAGAWPATVTPALFKTNAAGLWERVPGAVFAAGSVTAQVTSFSWFTVGAQPPVIPPSQQPQSVSVAAGQDATFTVGALGAPPFAYAWQRSDDGGSTWIALAGATARTLTVAAARSAPASAGGDNGARLRVVVSNGDGATTSQPATLTVTVAVVAPTIGTQPSSVSVVEGASATFSVVATGTNLLHQWQRSTDGGATYADVPGATNASLTLTALNLADSGQRLRAVVSNSAGSVTSDAATLTVTPLVPGGGAAGAVLAAGGTYSLALLKDGTLRSWGGGIGGTLGALGAGASITSRGLPGTVPAMSDVIAVSSGPATVLALRANGEVWGWATARSASSVPAASAWSATTTRCATCRRQARVASVESPPAATTRCCCVAMPTRKAPAGTPPARSACDLQRLHRQPVDTSAPGHAAGPGGCRQRLLARPGTQRGGVELGLQ
jgi:hypothetical protein